MATRESSSSVKITGTLDDTAVSTNTDPLGTEVDTQGYNSVTLMAFNSGANGAAGTYTVQCWSSDDSGSGFANDTDIVSQSGTVSFASTADGACAWIGYIGIKRYVKLNVASTGVTGATDIAGCVSLGHPHNAPVTSNA